jgi:hypothetical protein
VAGFAALNGASVRKKNVPFRLSCAVRARADVLVLHAELQVVLAAVPGDEPRHRVVDLIGVVHPRLRDVALLIDEGQEDELRVERRLVLAVGVEPRVWQRPRPRA